MKITVRAPATSANLGSGFDSLGLALDIWATVTVDTARRPPRNAGGVERLVEQGVQAVFGGPDKSPPIAVEWDGAIPLARGLGASAALRAAGLLAGNILAGVDLDGDALLEMGTRLENHPDNMAPCLFGGLQVVVKSEDKLLHIDASVPDDLIVVVFVPDFEMPTQESRRRLPLQFSRTDTIFNVGRAAMLIAALGAGRYDLLDEATQDRIHQPVRAQIFAGLDPIMEAAKSAGAAAAYLSGGGSTVAAFTREYEERIARLMTQAAIAHGFSGRSIIARPAKSGAEVVESVG
jgi:homoserine kinase